MNRTMILGQCLVTLTVWLAASFACGQSNTRWPAPKLGDANYQQWLTFIRPTRQELKWRRIRWHKSLSIAAAEAKKLQRPILLWTMNGHPCGET